MPDPDRSWKLESAPPSTVIREALKLLDGAERVNVRVAVSPAFSDVTSELMAIVGLVLSVVSTGRVLGMKLISWTWLLIEPFLALLSQENPPEWTGCGVCGVVGR